MNHPIEAIGTVLPEYIKWLDSLPDDQTCGVVMVCERQLGCFSAQQIAQAVETLIKENRITPRTPMSFVAFIVADHLRHEANRCQTVQTAIEQECNYCDNTGFVRVYARDYVANWHNIRTMPTEIRSRILIPKTTVLRCPCPIGTKKLGQNPTFSMVYDPSVHHRVVDDTDEELDALLPRVITLTAEQEPIQQEHSNDEPEQPHL